MIGRFVVPEVANQRPQITLILGPRATSLFRSSLRLFFSSGNHRRQTPQKCTINAYIAIERHCNTYLIPDLPSDQFGLPRLRFRVPGSIARVPPPCRARLQSLSLLALFPWGY